MCALDGLHVEVEGSGVWVGADGRIAGVGEWAGLPVAEAGDVVLIATEVLLLGSPENNVSFALCESDSVIAAYLSLKEQNCWLITCQTISSDDMMNYRVNSQIGYVWGAIEAVVVVSKVGRRAGVYLSLEVRDNQNYLGASGSFSYRQPSSPHVTCLALSLAPVDSAGLKIRSR